MSLRRPFFGILALFFVWGAVPLGLHLAGISRGVRAEYFESSEPTGVPAFTRIDPEISTAQLTSDWLGDVPQTFSVRWFGYLSVDRPGTYTIGTRSDDGSWLTVDGERVVDNGGNHPPVTRTTTLKLERGLHPILLEYTQAVAEYDVALLWGEDERSLQAVPSWRLSPSRLAQWKFPAARALDWISASALIAALVWLMWVAATSGREPLGAAVRAHPRISSLLLFVALTCVETWPLAAHPAALSRNDNGDTVLNEWTIAWIAHQAPRAPLQLFDGNIFYPEHDTVAYSESMIVQSALAAPLFWLGASPVLAYNIVLMAGFALSGWVMSIVMARWTGVWSAGVLSGVLFAFNAHVFTRLPHLQAQHVEFIPLALLALDALLNRPGLKRAATLAAWFALESLTSVYLLVFTAVALAASALARPEDWLGRRFRAAALWTAVAAAGAAVVLGPFLIPYWHAFHDQGLSRSEGDAIGFAASWQDYLSTPGRFHYAMWAGQFFTATALFPGVLAVVLTLVAVVTGVAWRDKRARMCLAFGVAGVAFSFGGKLPGYLFLFRHVPLFQGVRAVSRFGYLGIVATAMLAGFGFANLRTRIRRTPLRAAAAVAAVAIALFEPFCAPIWFSRYKGIPPIYATIRNEPNAVVAELPFWSTTSSFLHAPYMLNSTLHWKPMLNGYSGFQPPSFENHYEQLAGFPSDKAMKALRDAGVTDIFVHANQLGRTAAATVDTLPGVRRVASDGDIVLYHLYELPTR